MWEEENAHIIPHISWEVILQWAILFKNRCWRHLQNERTKWKRRNASMLAKVILLKISVYSHAVHRHCSKTNFYLTRNCYVGYLFHTCIFYSSAIPASFAHFFQTRAYVSGVNSLYPAICPLRSSLFTHKINAADWSQLDNGDVITLSNYSK